MNDSYHNSSEAKSGDSGDSGDTRHRVAMSNGRNGETPEAQLATWRSADRVSPRDVVPYSDTISSSGDSEGVDLRGIWGMMRRRKYILLGVFFAVVGVAVFLTWRARPIYQSSASILVTTSTVQGRGAEDFPGLEDMLGGTRVRSLETQIEIIKSAPIKEGALKRLSPEAQAVLKEYHTTTVTPVRSTDIISVVVRGYSAPVTAAYANAICQEYMEQNTRQNREQLRTARVYVQDQLQTVRARLDKARQELMRFKQVSGSVDLEAESAGKVSRLDAAEAELRQAQSERAARVAQLQKLRGLADSMTATQVVPNAIVRRPAVEAMKEQKTRLELERLAALQEYTPQSEQVKLIEGQIAAINERLGRESQTEIGSWNTVVNPVRQSLTQDIARLEGEVKALEARGATLRQAVATVQTDLARLPQNEYRLGQLSTDAAALQQAYQMLNERYQSLRISEAARVANARVTEAADEPSTPISPRKTRNLLVAIVLGLMLALALATLADHMDDRVHSAEDAENVTGLTVLAQVPYVKEPSRQNLLGNWDKVTPVLESYRMLRTNIEFSSVDEPIRALVMTSSLPNEGKSSSSVDLAIVMAMDGKQVILVDADLRRPSLHRMFGLSNTVGFTNVVAGTISIEDALQETEVPNLRVLTSGPIPPNPPELLNSKAGRACLERARQMSDFLIIDTPPALVMADARIVASIAGAVLLVISVQEAGGHEIARTSDQLAQSGAHVLGVVLNKLTHENGGYYGYYGYKNPYFGDYMGDGQEKRLEASKVS